MENSVETIAEVKVNYVEYPPLVHKSTHFIMKGDHVVHFTAEGKRFGQAGFALDRSVLSISDHLHLHAPKDVLQEDSFCGFPRNQKEMIGFLKTIETFAFLHSSQTCPHLHDLSKI